LMTAYGNVETAVEAMKRGAYDFLTKPVSLEKLEIIIKRALQQKVWRRRTPVCTSGWTGNTGWGDCGAFEGVAGCAGAVKQVASSRATVLVLGRRERGRNWWRR